MHLKSTLIALFAIAPLLACGGGDEEETIFIRTNNANNNGANNGTNNGSNNGTNGANNGANNNDVASTLDVLLETTVTTTANGKSVDVTFDVPEGAQSLTITVVGEAPTMYTLDSWTNGDGTELVYPNWTSNDPGGLLFQMCIRCEQRIAVAEGAWAGILPGHPGVDVEPGTHTIKIYSFTRNNFGFLPLPGDVDVHVVAKMAPRVPKSGTLDVNLFFTGANGWTAQTAPSDESLQKLLDDVDGIWAQAGVQLGQIRYYDIGEQFQAIENAAMPDSELTEMFALSRNATDDAVNVFFVEELILPVERQGMGVLLGIAGGIPGPANGNGTPRSGVALAAGTAFTPVPLYKVFAHEVGHFLGLYHTSENDIGFGPRIHDQLEDTPEGNMQFLMHASGNGNTLSESQGMVMRLNPWVRNGGE